MFLPNKYQEAVFYAVEHQDNNLVVMARAGTGKTTTILQAVEKLGHNVGSILLCAFNKAIQKELERRAPGHIDVRTLHSIGLGALRRSGDDMQIDGDRTKKLVKQLLRDTDCYIQGRQKVLMKLIGLSKNKLVRKKGRIMEIAYSHGIEDREHPADVITKQAMIILDRCQQDTSVIDFDDMIWLPPTLNIYPKSYDVVFVDEAQDLNASQRWLIEQTVRDGGRLIAVGDSAQAIYKWRGAGGDVLSKLQSDFKAEKLPLSITYRCPKKIVEMAKKFVPDFEAAEDAPEGEVLYKTDDDIVKMAEPGDFILSRTNAPLMSVCLNLLEANKPAQIRGRDIGRSLATFARTSKAVTVAELTAWLQEYERMERERLLPDQEEAFGILLDKIRCLGVLMKGQEYVDQVCNKIETIFSDTDSGNYILCSTVHKAKGLERDRVWVLYDTFNVGKGEEEDNIYYVAITRTKKSLVFVGRAAPTMPETPPEEEKKSNGVRSLEGEMGSLDDLFDDAADDIEEEGELEDDDNITLDDFVEIERDRITRFLDWHQAKHEEDPEEYPFMLSETAWSECFREWTRSEEGGALKQDKEYY